MIDCKGHRFEQDIIRTCVRGYLAYPLRYQNLEEVREERGVEVDHSTLYRTRIAVAEICRALRRRARLTP